MDNNIYEVERDQYVGVVQQINPKTTEVYTSHTPDATIMEIKTKHGTLLTRRIIYEDHEQYYVFELPKGPNQLPPKTIRKINLETKEEVQAFFNALGQLQKEHKDG